MTSEDIPNVLFITADSLRADHVSCCVADPSCQTPHLDEIASKGTVFTRAFAQAPFTTFSMPSLFTSRYPSGLHYTSYNDGSLIGVSIEDEQTITEAFADAGYATAGFHSNPLLSDLFHFDRGFDTFDADLPLGVSDVSPTKLVLTKVRRLLRRHAYLPAETLTDRNVAWIEDRDVDDPFFLWTHYMDPHGPYQAKSGFAYYNKIRAERLWQKAVHRPEQVTDAERETLVDTYRKEVRYTDRHVGRLVNRVRALTDRPLVVVFTADHGEGFGEHGFYSHPHELYDELIHVPLIVSLSSQPGGRTIKRPVELIDVAPTVLEAVGVGRPESFEGAPSLFSIDRADGSKGADQPDDVVPVFSEAQLGTAYVGAARTPGWKYIYHEVDSAEYLYDLSADPDEQHDCSDDRPERTADLSTALTDHRERDAVVDGAATTVDGLPNADVQDRLERLGYL